MNLILQGLQADSGPIPVLSFQFQGTVSPGEAAHQDLIAYVGSQMSFTASMLDINGEPINEGTNTYKFVASNLDGSYAFEEAATLSGDDGNQITFVIETENTAAPNSLTYDLWNTTQNQVRFTGSLQILPATVPQ